MYTKFPQYGRYAPGVFIEACTILQSELEWSHSECNYTVSLQSLDNESYCSRDCLTEHQSIMDIYSIN